MFVSYWLHVTLCKYSLVYCAVACIYVLTLKDSVTFMKKSNCLKCLPHIKNLSLLLLLNDTLNCINYSSSAKHFLNLFSLPCVLPSITMTDFFRK